MIDKKYWIAVSIMAAGGALGKALAARYTAGKSVRELHKRVDTLEARVDNAWDELLKLRES